MILISKKFKKLLTDEEFKSTIKGLVVEAFNDGVNNNKQRFPYADGQYYWRNILTKYF